MRCIYCGSQWSVQPELETEITSCPFCGESLIPAVKKYETIEEVLVVISETFGRDILSDSAKLLAYFSDLAPHLDKQRRLLKSFIEFGGVQKALAISQESDVEQRSSIERLASQMHREMYIDKNASCTICEAFVHAATERKTSVAAGATEEQIPAPAVSKEKHILRDAKGTEKPQTLKEIKAFTESAETHILAEMEKSPQIPMAGVDARDVSNQNNSRMLQEKLRFKKYEQNPPCTVATRSLNRPAWVYQMGMLVGVFGVTVLIVLAEVWLSKAFEPESPMSATTVSEVFEHEASTAGLQDDIDVSQTSNLEITDYSGEILGYYTGDLLNGVPTGVGTMKYVEGDVYEGEWSSGERSGQGKMTYADGGVYEGAWDNDMKNGKGTQSWASGTQYEGDFSDNQMTGYGVLVWADGGRYEGDFVNGQRTGHGLQIDPNGAQYEGDFVDGKMEGQGTATYPDGDQYEGSWVDGNINGYGVYTWADGKRYEGNFVNGQRTGYGVLTQPEGYRYEGNFVEDQMTGYGVYTLPNGEVWYEGQWINAQPVESVG